MKSFLIFFALFALVVAEELNENKSLEPVKLEEGADDDTAKEKRLIWPPYPTNCPRYCQPCFSCNGGYNPYQCMRQPSCPNSCQYFPSLYQSFQSQGVTPYAAQSASYQGQPTGFDASYQGQQANLDASMYQNQYPSQPSFYHGQPNVNLQGVQGMSQPSFYPQANAFQGQLPSQYSVPLDQYNAASIPQISLGQGQLNAVPYSLGQTQLNAVPYSLGQSQLNAVPYSLGQSQLNAVPYSLGQAQLNALPTSGLTFGQGQLNTLGTSGVSFGQPLNFDTSSLLLRGEPLNYNSLSNLLSGQEIQLKNQKPKPEIVPPSNK